MLLLYMCGKEVRLINWVNLLYSLIRNVACCLVLRMMCILMGIGSRLAMSDQLL